MDLTLALWLRRDATATRVSHAVIYMHDLQLRQQIYVTASLCLLRQKSPNVLNETLRDAMAWLAVVEQGHKLAHYNT